MGSGVTLVYRGEEEVASIGLGWLVELPSIPRRDYKWQEKLKNEKKNTAILFLLQSCNIYKQVVMEIKGHTFSIAGSVSSGNNQVRED